MNGRVGAGAEGFPRDTSTPKGDFLKFVGLFGCALLVAMSRCLRIFCVLLYSFHPRGLIRKERGVDNINIGIFSGGVFLE